MYYRYKIKKKNGKIIKFLIIVMFISLTGYFGYKYRQHITFWKYSYNKLFEKIERANRIKNIDKKRDELIELTKEFEIYKDQNQIDPEGFLMAGHVHFLLGKTYLGGNFSELFINDRLKNIGKKSRAQFIKAIINIRKGSVLAGGQGLNNRSSVVLVWSLFYTKYSDIKDINEIVKKIAENKLLKNIEDIRLYSLINIISDNVDYGIDYLQKYGMVDEGILGKLYLATSQRAAQKYTDSIMNYKDIISRTSDNKVLKLIYYNLGKIYYNQSLYKESLVHFNMGLDIDKMDNYIKIWIGKNYSALGDNDRAKAIWSEVLAADGSNNEVKKLLGVM